MGQGDFSGRASGGGTAAEGSEWVSDSAVVCKTSAGVGASWSVVVTGGMQTGSVTEGLSYDEEMASGVAGANQATGGGGEVTVLGASMGARAGSVGGRLGGTGSEMSGWVSDSSVVCQVGTGAEGSGTVMLTVGMQTGSLTEAVSFEGPMVSADDVSNVAGREAALLTIT
eukprot:1727265-Rhodomonas_salina.1